MRSKGDRQETGRKPSRIKNHNRTMITLSDERKVNTFCFGPRIEEKWHYPYILLIKHLFSLVVI